MKDMIRQICDRVYTNGLRFKGGIPQNSTDVCGRYILKGVDRTDGTAYHRFDLPHNRNADKRFNRSRIFRRLMPVERSIVGDSRLLQIV